MLYQLSYFRISSFLKGVFFVELLSSVGHYREVTPSFFVRSPQIRSSINSGFFFSNETVVRFRLKLWEKMDSNHRRYKPADLQSAPFGHSGILPFFRFFRAIPSSDFASSLLTTSRLLRRSSLVLLGLIPKYTSKSCFLRSSASDFASSVSHLHQ